jgi:predicted O-methyltransferase YrrM
MPWWFAVAERDHELQNPTSAEKIRLLGERLRLRPDSQVLDIACGKCGPAVLLAREFGCRITGVERAPEFASAARERIAAAGLEQQVEVVEQDAASFTPATESYDVALCLGASFIWNGLEGTLAALVPAVRPQGHVVVGEPYWRRSPLPEGIDDEDYVSLRDTARRFDTARLSVDTIIASSLDDWDRYETLHWRALEDWLAENSDDPDAAEFRARHESERDKYLSWQRELLGWAIFAARKKR